MYTQALPISRQSIFVDQILYMKKWLWQKIPEQFSRLNNFHVSSLLMKILFYLLTHSPWLLNHFLTAFCNLLNFSIFISIGAVLLPISMWFYSNPGSKFKVSEEVKTGSRLGSENILILVKLLQSSRNYLILIPPNTESILVKFDGFDYNYGSISLFP